MYHYIIYIVKAIWQSTLASGYSAPDPRRPYFKPAGECGIVLRFVPFQAFGWSKPAEWFSRDIGLDLFTSDLSQMPQGDQDLDNIRLTESPHMSQFFVAVPGDFSGKSAVDS